MFGKKLAVAVFRRVARSFFGGVLILGFIGFFELVDHDIESLYAASETRYMRGDQQTINSLTAYSLGTSQSSTSQSNLIEKTRSGNLVVDWGVRIWKRTSAGSETEITSGTPVAQVTRSAIGEGMQNNTWSVPLTSLNATDSIVVRVYAQIRDNVDWSVQATFTTEQLGSEILPAGTWTFYYYTWYDTYNTGGPSGRYTRGRFYWGDSTYNSRIENFNHDVLKIVVGTSGTQTSQLSIPSSSNYVGGAFTMSSNNSQTVTGIVIKEAGSVDANADLSNVKLYYETSETCTYDGNENQYGSTASFNASEQASFSGSLAVGTSQVCFYIVLDVGSGAALDETLEVEITNPSSDVTVSTGEVSPATAVSISGTTTLKTPVVTQAHYRWGEDTSAEEVLSRLYGGSSLDDYYGVDGDSNYLYTVGSTVSEGTYAQATIIRYDKSDLSISLKKIYSPVDVFTINFDSVFVDDSYVYALGKVTIDSDPKLMAVKFNKSDLSIALSKIYSSINKVSGATDDTSYIYVAGMDYGTDSTPGAYIVKISKADLSVSGHVNYSVNNNAQEFMDIASDTDYLYAVGVNTGELVTQAAMIIKFTKSDLSIQYKKNLDGSSLDYFYGVDVDDSYVYAVGQTYSEGTSGSALVVKLNKSDLSLDTQKTLDGSGYDRFIDVLSVDSSNIYLIGYTTSEGAGSEDGLIVKINKSDITIDSKKIYGTSGSDFLEGIYYEQGYLYLAGRTNAAFGQGNFDAWITKMDGALVSGTRSSSPSGFTYQDSGLTLSTTNLSLSDSNLTLYNESNTLNNESTSISNGTLSESSAFAVSNLVWKADEDTAYDGQAKSENVRLRFSIKNTGAAANSYQYRLEVAPKGGAATCEAVSLGNYTTVPTTTGGCGSAVACMTTTDNFADGDSTTDVLTSEGTFVEGKKVEDPSNKTGSISLATNYYTEVEYNFQFTSDAVNSTSYCFRVTNDGANLDYYTSVAEIVTAGASVSITISDGVVSYGILGSGASADTTSGDTQTVTNNGGVAVNLNIKGVDTACPWILSSNSGGDQYVHEFSLNSGESWSVLTTSYQTLASDISIDGTLDFDLKITTPSFSSCYSQQSADVTVQAVSQ